MSSKISIYYDSYSNNSRILINNKELSPYSSLFQYMTEPIYKWVPHLFEKLYSIVEDDYYIEFTGRTEEHEIVTFYASQDHHCRKVIMREFPISISLQQRMKVLNDYIKQNRTILFQREKMNVHFYLPMSLRSLYEELESISVNNRYCKTNVICEIFQDMVSINHDSNEVGIAIVRDRNQMSQVAEIIRTQKYFTVIVLGDKMDFLGDYNNCYLFESTEEDLFDTIFKVLLLFPLQEVYNKSCLTIEQLNSQIEVRKRIHALRETQPILMINLPDSIEIGTSQSIVIKSSPKMEKLPDLVYEWKPEGIVKLVGLRLTGLKAGVASVRIFRKGELQPIHEDSVRVYTRNRITSINLNYDECSVAIGEEILLQRTYFPEDADNVNQIRWESENPAIAVVSPYGKIIGIKTGVCKIFCIAEKVVTYCKVDVRPRLREIILPDDILEERYIYMTVGDEYPLDIKIIPANAIDNKLIFYSENSMVANIVRGVIEAVGPGRTSIKIQNTSRRVTEEFVVEVENSKKIKNKTKKKKFRFF